MTEKADNTKVCFYILDTFLMIKNVVIQIL